MQRRMPRVTLYATRTCPAAVAPHAAVPRVVCRRRRRRWVVVEMMMVGVGGGREGREARRVRCRVMVARRRAVVHCRIKTHRLLHLVVSELLQDDGKEMSFESRFSAYPYRQNTPLQSS